MTGADRVRTAAWYGDRPLDLAFPEGWTVTVQWPRTPPRLSDGQIEQALERPVGQPPIRELARDRSRPLVIVDDITRPTPAGRILPFVLRQLADAGIPAGRVRVIVGIGTHAPPSSDAIRKKVGPVAALSCQLLVHDHIRNLEWVGRTSFGSPVIVDREVLASDLLIGVGGVYPQHSTGFGGGSKLALGVLGKRSIISLHYGHPSMNGSYEIANDFRRDLDEIAAMIGLRTMISVHVNADREVVRVTSGDHARYYEQAVAFSREAYRAPLPGDADVVIANAYPIDVSLTFMRSKGMTPLFHAKPSASRILIAACSEGVGHHGLFPFVNGPRFQRQIHLARIAVATPSAIPGKAAGFLRRRAGKVLRLGGRVVTRAPSVPDGANPIWLYVPGQSIDALPAALPGMAARSSWEEILARVRAEQEGNRRLSVALYPCAPLQVLESEGGDKTR